MIRVKRLMDVALRDGVKEDVKVYHALVSRFLLHVAAVNCSWMDSRRRSKRVMSKRSRFCIGWYCSYACSFPELETESHGKVCRRSVYLPICNRKWDSPWRRVESNHLLRELGFVLKNTTRSWGDNVDKYNNNINFTITTTTTTTSISSSRNKNLRQQQPINSFNCCL